MFTLKFTAQNFSPSATTCWVTNKLFQSTRHLIKQNECIGTFFNSKQKTCWKSINETFYYIFAIGEWMVKKKTAVENFCAVQIPLNWFACLISARTVHHHSYAKFSTSRIQRIFDDERHFILWLQSVKNAFLFRLENEMIEES